MSCPRCGSLYHSFCADLPMQHFNRLTPAELERLAILAEECNEAGQIACKILRHGYGSYNPAQALSERLANRFLLEKELGDVMWIMRAMCEAYDINAERIEKHADAIEARPILRCPPDLALYPYAGNKGILQEIKYAQRYPKKATR